MKLKEVIFDKLSQNFDISEKQLFQKYGINAKKGVEIVDEVNSKGTALRYRVVRGEVFFEEAQVVRMFNLKKRKAKVTE